MDSMEEWMQWLDDAGRSPRTQGQYQWVIERFAVWLGRDPVTATSDEIRLWLHTFRDRTPETRRAYRAALNSYYTWAVDQAEIRDRSPMPKVPPVRVPASAPRPLSPLEVATLLARSDGRMRAWLLCGLDAGLRRSEIAAVSSHDLVGRRLHVVGKGGRHRAVPVTMRLASELAQYEPGRLWQVSPNHLGHKVGSFMRANGVDGSTHSLRHTFATQFYKASGHDLRRTQHVLGHSSPTTTARYVGFEDDLDEIVDRMVA